MYQREGQRVEGRRSLSELLRERQEARAEAAREAGPNAWDQQVRGFVSGAPEGKRRVVCYDRACGGDQDVQARVDREVGGILRLSGVARWREVLAADRFFAKVGGNG